MLLAYSRLKMLLEDQKLSVPELHRRILQGGQNVNLKSLYRLRNENAPLERLDLRVAGAICDVCKVPFSELTAFSPRRAKLRRLPAAQQKRLDELMTRNNDGKLTRREQDELTELVRLTEEITLDNARMLAGRHRKLSHD